MAFPNHLLNPSTWRIVGLGLTTSMFALGALSIVSPSTAASSLGVIPTTPEGHEVAAKGMVFLGIRDIQHCLGTPSKGSRRRWGS
tara:strand:+ start:409 stop:663 length:255 start_codon:yes stop_codon:yes gene_type:complete